MPGKLENRTALITGANRGIGLAVAKAYAKEGAKLLLAGRSAEALQQVQSDIAAAGGNARVLTVAARGSRVGAQTGRVGRGCRYAARYLRRECRFARRTETPDSLSAGRLDSDVQDQRRRESDSPGRARPAAEEIRLGTNHHAFRGRGEAGQGDHGLVRGEQGRRWKRWSAFTPWRLPARPSASMS